MSNGGGDLQLRTKEYALRVIGLVESLPRNQTTAILGKQLLRSGTSVGANYRAAHRAKSTPDFIAKMSIVEEEANECGYWLELLVESGHISHDRIGDLLNESRQLVAIAVASINTAKRRTQKRT
jgi:four helix bundle protein